MRLFQYWDTPEPPDEVAEWIDGFRATNPEMKHRLFDRDSASWFIGKWVGRRERQTFDALAVPAMQADYFRLCAIWAQGGVWVDADYQSGVPLRDVLEGVPETLLLTWYGHVDNSFMMCRDRGNPFLHACRDLATLNVEARTPERAYIATGPGVLSAVRVLIEPESSGEVATQFQRIRGSIGDSTTIMERARTALRVTPELERAFKAATLIEVAAMKRWLSRKKRPAYKKTTRHWQNWDGPQYID
ncbi:MAG TPA: glycosyltransferase [Caulobacteraceae bacterium]